MTVLTYTPLTDNTYETERQHSTWVPSVDIIEGEHGFSLELDLPGFLKDDFKVTIENGVLGVKGERKLETPENKKLYRYLERPSGVFERSFRLPEYLDGEKVKASYTNGVLKLDIPKKPEAKPSVITIN